MLSRLISIGLLASVVSALGGCGGGSSSEIFTSSSSSSGGSTSSSSSGSSTTSGNTLPITIDGGSTAIVQADGIIPNFAYVSVTICAHGTSNCQTVDHLQVDTQSVGLRIMGSVLNSTLLAALPTATTSAGQPVFECAPFADGYSWGRVASADIKFTSSETASAVPIHIIQDPTSVSIPAVPTDCVNAAGTDFAENTPATFAANGVLGIGALLQDCGAECVSGTVPGSYYGCTSDTGSGTCADITMAVGAQVQNPVAVLASADNNGVAIALSTVSASGEASASGTLYFGVGTESNSALGSATVYQVDSQFGQFLDTQYAGADLPGSVLDLGSNAYFFNSSIVQCSNADFAGYYCPSGTLAQSATIQGESSVSFNADGSAISGVRTGTQMSFDFDIGNAQTVLTSSMAALPTLGATGMSGTFDWGLPFFYGRTLFVVFEGRSATGSSQTGPYMAF
jgi:Protein of unknown function (DUF3443)